MIQSRPKLCGNKLIKKSFTFIFLCVVAFMVSSAFGKYSFVLQFLGILSATYSLFILIKYVIPDYLYTIDGQRITIHKVTKSQSVCIADMDIADIVHLPFNEEEYKNSDIRKKVSKLYKYIKNPDSKQLKYVVFTDNKSYYTLVIEPDDNFFNELCNQIENYKYTGEDDDE